MATGQAFRLILLVALLFSLVRVVASHSAHLGLFEWAAASVLAVALLASLVAGLRRAA